MVMPKNSSGMYSAQMVAPTTQWDQEPGCGADDRARKDAPLLPAQRPASPSTPKARM